jgi:hypothetical protein
MFQDLHIPELPRYDLMIVTLSPALAAQMARAPAAGPEVTGGLLETQVRNTRSDLCSKLNASLGLAL